MFFNVCSKCLNFSGSFQFAEKYNCQLDIASLIIFVGVIAYNRTRLSETVNNKKQTYDSTVILSVCY